MRAVRIASSTDTTNHVLALEIVLPDGNDCGDRSPWGDSAGLDLVERLWVPKDLRIVTRSTLRLTPTRRRSNHPARFRSAGRCSRAVFRLSATDHSAALEMIDRLGIEAVEKSVYAADTPEMSLRCCWSNWMAFPRHGCVIGQDRGHRKEPACIGHSTGA